MLVLRWFEMVFFYLYCTTLNSFSESDQFLSLQLAYNTSRFTTRTQRWRWILLTVFIHNVSTCNVAVLHWSLLVDLCIVTDDAAFDFNTRQKQYKLTYMLTLIAPEYTLYLSPITTWSMMTELAILTFFPMTQCAPTQDFFTEDLSSILVYSPIIESLPTCVLGATSALEGTRVIDAPCFVAYTPLHKEWKGGSIISPLSRYLHNDSIHCSLQLYCHDRKIHLCRHERMSL